MTKLQRDKPITELTDEELTLERNKWDKKINEARYWGAAVAAAHEFKKDCDREISRRALSKLPTARLLVIIESPYSGDVERNTIYARRAMLDSLSRNEAPYASHLLYTQVLDDTDPIQRKWGMDAGFSWHKVADLSAAYIDYGTSHGMEEGIKVAKAYGITIDYRTIGENP